MNHVVVLLVVELAAVGLALAARATTRARRGERCRQMDLVVTQELTIVSCVLGLSALGMYESVPDIIAPGVRNGRFLLRGTEVFAVILSVVFLCHMWGTFWITRLAGKEAAGELKERNRPCLVFATLVRNFPGVISLGAVLSMLVLGR